MENRKQWWVMLVLACFAHLLSGCHKDDDVQTTGTLKGTVVDAQTLSPLSNIRLVVFDAATNNPTGATLVTGGDGSFQTALLPGNYYLRVSGQGYEAIPGKAMSPIAFTIAVAQTVEQPFRMSKSSVVNGGIVSGRVSEGTAPLAGALVIASSEAGAYSGVSGKDGNYFIYNLPAGSYQVKAWMIDYNSADVNTSVTAGGETNGMDLALTKGASGQVQGQISFLATGNVEVDVTLIHPATGEPIPGLSKMTSGGSYSLTGVPAGTYIARATYVNDTKVMDPDWIIKNGEPLVTVGSGAVTRDFSVTGAVTLASPTNAATTTQPVLVSGPNPTFSWVAYSSTDDYVIEVTDANGKVIWGGFSNNNTTKNIVIPKAQTSIAFNADGKAVEALQSGQLYRWKIYASKSDIKEATGWKLISSSEDQQGLIRIE